MERDGGGMPRLGWSFDEELELEIRGGVGVSTTLEGFLEICV